MSKESNFPKEYSPELVAQIEEYGYPWYRAGVVMYDEYYDTFCMVEEAKVPDGHGGWKDAHDIWNLPAGRLMPGENFAGGALREALEETGYIVNLGDIVNMRVRSDGANSYVIVMYAATIVKQTQPVNPDEIRSLHWFTFDEIKELAEKGKLRSKDLVLNTIAKFKSGVTFPSDFIEDCTKRK